MPESYRFSLKCATKIKKTVEIPSNKCHFSYVPEIQFRCEIDKAKFGSRFELPYTYHIVPI